MAAGADRIGLGTAQFGLDYGITNSEGKVDSRAVADILSEARKSGVTLLDTAPLYGDSEAALGVAGTQGFRLVTKTPKFGASADGASAAAALEQSARESLRRLHRPSLDGLLIHDPADLLGPLGDTLWSRMALLKENGLVAKIGVSIYTGEELDALLARYPLDIVQIPINALDRRLVEGGQLGRLAARGVETHARTVFLQGLLLAAPGDIPPRFRNLSEAVAKLDAAFSDQRLSRQEGLLATVMHHDVIAYLVCGVTSVAELRELVTAAERAAGALGKVELPVLPELCPSVLNPARWAELD